MKKVIDILFFILYNQSVKSRNKQNYFIIDRKNVNSFLTPPMDVPRRSGRRWRKKEGKKMEYYNYLENIKDDVIRWMDENSSYYDDDELQDPYYLMADDDAVTGNASGSYWFNSWKAQQAITGNWFLLHEAMEEFCYSKLPDPEVADILIRIYLLPQAISEVFEEKGW